MEVILLSKIYKLGNSGTVIHVKSGYARNFLIPQGKAILANKKNIDSFKAQKIELEKERKRKFIEAQVRLEKIKNIKSITIFSKIRQKGENKIFGSVGVRDIVKEFLCLGVKLHKKEIRLLNGLIRHIGQHNIIIQLHKDIQVEFIVHVVEKK